MTEEWKVEKTIVDEWAAVKPPAAPELKQVIVNPSVSALLILDIQNQNCNSERRPRCVASIPRIQRLQHAAKARKMTVIYTLTRNASPDDIRKEVFPSGDEPIIKSGVDKFYGTNLEDILKDRNIETLILVGTSAHGAVLHTATAAALRGFKVIVPVDGVSAENPYAEQYTAWHLANAPGTRGQVVLTRVELLSYVP